MVFNCLFNFSLKSIWFNLRISQAGKNHSPDKFFRNFATNHNLLRLMDFNCNYFPHNKSDSNKKRENDNNVRAKEGIKNIFNWYKIYEIIIFRSNSIFPFPFSIGLITMNLNFRFCFFWVILKVFFCYYNFMNFSCDIFSFYCSWWRLFTCLL